MYKCIVMANQKGGVGKTITAFNVAYDLAVLGKRVLLIDADPQCNLTYVSGASGEKTLRDAVGNLNLKYVPVKIRDGLDIVLGDPELITRKITKQTFDVLLKTLDPGVYDFVIIDTPPNLGEITISAFCAADNVITTTTADYFAIQGISKLSGTLAPIHTLNPKIKIAGIVITMYDQRPNYAKFMRDALEKIAKQIHTRVITPPIRKGIAAVESLGQQAPLQEYAPNSNPAMDYMELTKSIIKILK